MSTFVLAAVLLGALIHASWNALIKGQQDKFLASLLVGIGTGLMGLPVMAAFPLPPAEAWPYIAASAIIHVGYFGLIGLAYRTTDLGIAYPLTRGSAPLFTAMFAYLLIGETLGLNGWIAAVAIALGIIALSADAFVRGGLNRATALVAFLNAGVIVLYTLIDGLGARITGNAPLYVSWMCFGAGLMVFLIALATRRDFMAEVKSGWWIGLLGGIFAIVSYSIATWAMTRAPIGLVASLRETSVLFAAILGAILFKEPFGPKRWAALALIVGGIVFLRLAGS